MTRWRRAVDAAWCGLAAMVTIAVAARGRSDGAFVVVVVVAGALAVALVSTRRRWPVPSLAVGLGASFVTLVVAGEPTALLPVAILLIYNVARRTTRVGAAWAAVAGMVVLASSVVVVFGVDDALSQQLASAVAWPALAAAIGDAARSRAEVVANAIERAERAERTRDETARRQVVEERLRIARDLHDAVGHHVAVANVQAGVAGHLLDTDPVAARAALDHVRSATQQVLDDFGDILGVLRSEGDAPPPTGPTPTIADVDDLIRGATRSGLDVTYRSAGRPRTLARPVTIAAYRLIQEALTNAHKHGGGHAEVTVAYDADGLRITVTNRVTGAAAPGASGFGLTGMRERITAAGGELEAGRRDGGRFVVDARLPSDPTGASA
ncbi:MAG: sensor histidine kinase [Acidimicrobiales bacterium]